MTKGEREGGSSLRGSILNASRLAGGGTISACAYTGLEPWRQRRRRRTLWDVAKAVAFAALVVTLVVTLWR